MSSVSVYPGKKIGSGFIPAEFLPPGKDEYHLRELQNPSSPGTWRNLEKEERELLLAGGNTAENWDRILVNDEFDPTRIRNSHFFGLVRIGRLRDAVLEHHDMAVQTGLFDSTIIDCDIGDDTAVHNVHYLSHYIVGAHCILKDIDEMNTTNHAKFGNGILKDGEEEETRVCLDLMNETGSRTVLPFDGMITADAYLWGKYRDDTALQDRLKSLTQGRFSSLRGYYGTIGEQCVIKTTRILKDVKVGTHCYIKGANKLKNLTINSSKEEPSQIGEGVELVNGIIGYGCHIFYGCKAVRFILGNNSSLKYGARLIHSFLGDNSTVSCCEVLNNLIFPAHEQHHNNSFLVAAVVMGQSNLAAGATIGSNHNSRANDNEIQAGRGFWPGLCTSLKHSSTFASYTLIAKGAYPAEMYIPLPFSLVNNSESGNRLEIMPAFWWMYNMYALVRNSWKFNKRDTRKRKNQHIEFDFLAPDTVEEILHALELLEQWTGEALFRARHGGEDSMDAFRDLGRTALRSPDPLPDDVTVFGSGMEKTKRKTVIIKPKEAYGAYTDMLRYYAATNLMNHAERKKGSSLAAMKQALSAPRCTSWINLGGQLVPEPDVDSLRADIGNGTLADWDAVHSRYDDLWRVYPEEKCRHAWAVFCLLCETQDPTVEDFRGILSGAGAIQTFIRDQVYESRNKDYKNPFRRATYRNIEEMNAAIGTIEDNSFIRQVRKETDQYIERIDETLKKVR